MKYFHVLLLCFIAHISFSQGYNFIGDSYSIGNNCYTLTPNQEWQNGAIWYNESIDLNDPYHLQFTANFGSNDAGADGMVFVLQQVGNEVLGEAGGGMGFSGFSPSLGVEFDTHQNFEVTDPTEDHLAVLKNGVNDHQSLNNVYGPISISESSGNIEDGIDHIIDIYWDPAAFQFQVWVDCIPRVEIYVDLLGTIFTDSPEVFWGFTGATGSLTNLQRVCLDPFILGTPEQYETCTDEPVQLEASAATFGTLNWEPAEFLDDPNTNTPIATVSETTEFTLTYADLCNIEQTSQTTVVVYDPSVELGEDVSECVGNEITIDALGEFDDLIWSDQSTDPSLQVSESGTFWVEAIEGVCSASDTVDVNFIPLPDWNNDYEEICQGETYTADLSDSGYEVLWFDGSDELVRNFSDEGTYNFELINDQGCAESFSVEISVPEFPQFSFNDQHSICEGQSITLETGLTDADVVWNTGDNGSSITVNSEGQYWALASVNGCEYSDTTTLFVNTILDFDIVGTESLCPGETGELTALIEEDVIWTNGQSGNTISINLPGTYTAITADENGCESQASFNVQGLRLPTIILEDYITRCEQDLARVYAQSSDNLNLLWSDGTTGPELATDIDGDYTVSLSNECGSVDRTVTIESNPCEQTFYVPNAFTPDQDGLNDIFKVIVDNYQNFEMRVFNQTGQEVFSSTNPNLGWNGSFQNNGYYCEPGMYILKYTVQFDANDIQEGFGHINLIR